MADFNQLFHDYFGPSLADLMAEIDRDLELREVPDLFGNDTALNINSSRTELRGFLRGTELHKSYSRLVDAAYLALSGRNPASATDSITPIRPDSRA